MPGRRLSHIERRLLGFWQNPPGQFGRPLLRQVRIEGGPGLRGIQRLVMSFPYPFTAICGRNGVGKSTVLGLAALSADAPVGWTVFWGNTRPRTRPTARAQYTFTDFFHRRGGDPPLDGLRLVWVSMNRGNEVEYVKTNCLGRWVHVMDAGRRPELQRQPSREIDFVPMSRVLSAAEYGSMRSAFTGAAVAHREPLTPVSLRRLSYILGRQYESAETLFVRGLGLPVLRVGHSYSGFHMGGGEASVVALLSRAQLLPPGGLLIIEEIELGLHAEAQARLVEVLIEVCHERPLQIICTTHSEVVLDQLPRVARVLLRKQQGEHEAIGGISTRFAIHEMSGIAQPELLIYTEDLFASTIVEEALAGAFRARVDVRDVGSNTTLARQAVAHLRSNAQLRCLSVFDGDCTEAMIEGWIQNERADRTHLVPVWLILPGAGLTPEQWVLQEASGREYLENLSRELNVGTDTALAHIEAMRVQLDAHKCEHILSQRTGLEEADARRALVRSVVRRHPALDQLRGRVSEALGQ